MKKIVCGFLVVVLGWFSSIQAQKRPNIILMMADDLGYNDLSSYRELNEQRSKTPPTSQTPYIDNLAKNGLQFTNFYSGAAVCSPSRAALLTGRNATRLGIYNFIPKDVPMHLKDKEITIAEMLKGKNYQTAHFGKWHLASENKGHPEPLDQGFDEAFWTYSNAKPTHKNPVNFIKNRIPLGKLEGYSSHLVVDEAIHWIKKTKDKNTPFYMNIWFHEPHLKVAAPDSLSVKHIYNKDYYGCIENMDYAVGKLMKYLKDNGLEENTIIIFTSDNGSKFDGSNDPLRGKKTFQYEGGVRVPFIVQWKGKISTGKISSEIGHFTDVLPTLANLTNTRVPKDRSIDGENISNVFLSKSKENQRKEPLFFYRYFHDPICMVRLDDLVLLGYYKKPKERLANYDEKEEALFKPKKGDTKNSQWAFQKKHMEAIKTQEPLYFEMYNVKKDVGQHKNILFEHPRLFKKMKKIMLKKRLEMITEGGNWYFKK
ncbi:sulfatase-like hydrolase/transferase [Polaribacter sp. Hel_I_88]|uniref:sulfatase-like hydrolase/transferase n=1 Tax=Polaribacter sp. Hel_I_88 TaxID=1250006 RepID=UPI00047C6F39|nr:sulfatase-like hydrolase/transferase [Polaribacter sp. Hel_I_88]